MGAILREGWETGGSASASGWVLVSGTALPIINTSLTSGKTVLPRKDILGNGGEYFAGSTSAVDDFAEKSLTRDSREVFARVAINVFSVGSNDSMFAGLVDSSNNLGPNVGQKSSSSAIELRRDTSLLATSAAGVADPTNDWVVLNIHMFVDNANGFIKVYQDYSYSSVTVESGLVDTQQSTDNFGRSLRLGFDGTVLDDIAVNDITLSYTAGTGAHPSIGEVITGSTSSSTTIVTAILNPTGSSGTLAATLQLRTVLVGGATDWSGDPDDDPFITDVAISSASLTTATIAGGLDANSGHPRDSLIFGLRPVSTSSAQLTGSDADMIDNHLLVDDRPMDDATALTTYVEETTTPGNRDLYELEDVSVKGFGPGDIGSIVTIELNAVAQRDGTGINNLAFVHEDVDGASGEIDSANQGMSISPDGHSELLDEASPGVSWTEAKIDALRIGVKLNS